MVSDGGGEGRADEDSNAGTRPEARTRHGSRGCPPRRHCRHDRSGRPRRSRCGHHHQAGQQPGDGRRLRGSGGGCGDVGSGVPQRLPGRRRGCRRLARGCSKCAAGTRDRDRQLLARAPGRSRRSACLARPRPGPRRYRALLGRGSDRRDEGLLARWPVRDCTGVDRGWRSDRCGAGLPSL